MNEKDNFKLCVINPNTSEAMTRQIYLAAKSIASPNTKITCTNPRFGPESIEGFYDEAFCVPGIIEEIEKNQGSEAYIIACFDDTGLDASRTFTDKPVIGIGEASYHAANMMGGQFSVITTLPRSISALENNLKKYGLYQNCCSVVSIELPVLELEKQPNMTEEKLQAKIEHLLDKTRTEIIVLGCAGMQNFASKMQTKFGVPIIEGITSSVKFAESFVALGFKTSKKSSYSYPKQKRYLGKFHKYQPKI